MRRTFASAELLVVAVIGLGAMACDRVSDSELQAAEQKGVSPQAPATVAPTKPSAAPPKPIEQAVAQTPPAPAAAPAPKGKVEWIDAPRPTADVAAFVRTELARAKGAGRNVIVEIGAGYCEPCRKFHAAATAGQLDGAFPALTVVSFSIDDDLTREAVASAGYVSNLIPLFALPKDDGTASGKQIEGSIHGNGSVDEITPRLRALIAS